MVFSRPVPKLWSRLVLRLPQGPLTNPWLVMWFLDFQKLPQFWDSGRLVLFLAGKVTLAKADEGTWTGSRRRVVHFEKKCQEVPPLDSIMRWYVHTYLYVYHRISNTLYIFRLVAEQWSEISPLLAYLRSRSSANAQIDVRPELLEAWCDGRAVGLSIKVLVAC